LLWLVARTDEELLASNHLGLILLALVAKDRHALESA
jgi:hypothetical protein